jgi:DNA repair protein RecO (recombination protein O)
MSEREEVLLERGFVLHQRPFRNTSQLLDCLTAGFGRVGLVAQGSRRSQSGRRAALQPFVPVRLSWVRRGELGRLTDVEAESHAFDLVGQRLLAAYYANELVMRLSMRGDPNADVFACYYECLIDLAARTSVARTLRLFEMSLLRAIGYGLELECDVVSGDPLIPERRYAFEFERGLIADDSGTAGAHVYRGRDLISLGSRLLDDPDSLRAARRLLGGVLHRYLGDRPLKTSAVLKDVLDIRGAGRP